MSKRDKIQDLIEWMDELIENKTRDELILKSCWANLKCAIEKEQRKDG